MKRNLQSALSAVLLLGALSGGALFARTGPAAPLTMQDRVRHELLMLPYIGVFDNLQFSVDQNNAVTLSGQVVRPIDRDNAGRAVKSIPGVSQITNNIEVLPLSPFDDRIRLATLRTLERTNPLSRYFWGVHPDIRIIVKNGNVTLDGIVLNEGDRILANLAANQVPNAFSVTNNLEVNPKP